MPADLTLIIPTVCSAARSKSLARAIQSVREQKCPNVNILLVVNGSTTDHATLTELESDPGLSVVRVTKASALAAVREGRLRVKTEFFAFLDDDDVLLPDTLATRLTAIQSSGADVLVVNGYMPNGDQMYADLDSVRKDPLATLMRRNWLLSCAGLFKTASVEAEFFRHARDYVINEWTLLGFKLIRAGKQITFLDTPGFQISDTPGSLSKQTNPAFFDDSIEIAEYFDRNVSGYYSQAVKEKLILELHCAADYYLRRGEVLKAWRYHLRSVAGGGFRYLPYSIRLLGLGPNRAPGAF